MKPALSPDGSRLYVADNGSDSLTVINTNAGSPYVETTIAPGGAPAGVAVSPDGQRLFVTYPALGAVAEFEFDAASSPPYRVATTTVGSNPTALAISRDGSLVDGRSKPEARSSSTAVTGQVTKGQRRQLPGVVVDGCRKLMP